MSIVVASACAVPTTIAALQRRLYVGAGVFCILGIIEGERLGQIFYDVVINDRTSRLRIRAVRQEEELVRPEVVIGIPGVSPYTGRVTWLGRYVHVVGKLREVNGEFHLFASGFDLVRTADSLSFHYIESAWTYLGFLRRPNVPITLSIEDA